MNVHIIYDSPYCQRFIDFVNEHFKSQSHSFVIISQTNRFNYIKILTPRILIINPQKDIKKFVALLKSSSKVFIHYLFDWICDFWANFTFLSIPTYWITWGGDFYPYLNYPIYGPETTILLKLNNIRAKSIANSKNRLLFLKNLKGILTWCTNDYILIKKYYGIKAQHFDFFYPVDFLDNANKVKNNNIFSGKKILLGNSASITNNHLELFNLVKNQESDKAEYIVPFSYGGPPWYIEQVRKYGQYLFRSHINFLDQFMNMDEYGLLLDNIDIACFYHMRQQGVGTMLLLLGQGKKVYSYLNPAVTWLQSNKIQIYNIEAQPKESEVSFYGRENAKKVRDLFSLERCFNYMDFLYN